MPDVLPDATPRLRFREMAEADEPDIASLDTAGPRGPADWIAWNRRSYADHGFGLWVVETHEGGFVGDCGLTVQEVEGEHLVEIGWHVRRDRRRRGLAAEAAGAVLDVARASGLPRVVAIIRPDNVASQGVARSIGMRLEREAHKMGGPILVFGADPGSPISDIMSISVDRQVPSHASGPAAGRTGCRGVRRRSDGLRRTSAR